MHPVFVLVSRHASVLPNSKFQNSFSNYAAPFTFMKPCWFFLSVLPVSSAAGSLDSPSSPVASSSLTKLEGKSPDLPLKRPFHQPSSTCTQSKWDSQKACFLTSHVFFYRFKTWNWKFNQDVKNKFIPCNNIISETACCVLQLINLL